nr:B3 domain-containing protein, DNA-binding pseudobarrel domain protein [Tanacetum cinerariifolium]
MVNKRQQDSFRHGSYWLDLPQELIDTSKSFTLFLSPNDEASVTKSSIINRTAVLIANQHNGPDKKKRIRPKVDRGPVVKNEVTKRLQKFITNETNGSDLKLVIQKVLYMYDLAPRQNRLNLPLKQLLTEDFLSDQERWILESDGEIKVRLVGPNLKMFKEPMELKIWDMTRTSWIYQELIDAAKSFTLFLSPNDEASVTKSSIINRTAVPIRLILPKNTKQPTCEDALAALVKQPVNKKKRTKRVECEQAESSHANEQLQIVRRDPLANQHNKPDKKKRKIPPKSTVDK